MKLPYSVLLSAVLAISAATAAPNRDRMVVVISLDGFPSYALKDPRLPIPTIRRLAHEGATAASMRTINPTVTWPSHTAMVTGVDASAHQVLYNGLMTRPTGAPGKVEPWRNKDEMVRRPTVYDRAHESGLTTAQVDWVAIYGARTITWQFAERPDPDGPIEKELIAAGRVTREQLEKFGDSSQAWRDRVWTDAAIHILTTKKPNLMLFHLLNMDSTHHRYSPMSPASYTAFSFLDDRVKEIYESVQKAGLLDRTTFLILSDHGFRAVQNVIRVDAPGAWVVPEGGTAMVYVTDPATKGEVLPRLKETLRAAEGIDTVIDRSGFGELGLPVEGDQSPDLVLAAKPGYAFTGGKGPAVSPHQGGSHGYLNTDPDMEAIFFACGAGIRRGATLDRISTMDIAPTIAELLGLRMENIQGRVLKEILE